MKTLQRNKYIEIAEASQQLRFRFEEKIYTTVKVTSELYFLALSQNIARYLSKCNKSMLDCHLCTPKTLLKF